MDIIPEQRVLIAVINLAIFDACLQPIKHRVVARRSATPEDFRIHPYARSAMTFLHGNGLNHFCNCLPFDPDWIRKKLQRHMFEDNFLIKPLGKQDLRISDIQRRYYRYNYQIWLATQHEQVLESNEQAEDL